MRDAEFLAALERRLRVLPEGERRDALEYYEEYLADAGEDYTDALDRLGSPAEVAGKIIADYAAGNPATDEPPKKKGLPVAWAVILAVFTVPVGLPLAITTGALAVALLCVMLSVLISFGVTAFALIVSGAASFVVGLYALTSNVPLAFMMIGTSLLAFGVGVLFAKLTAVLARSGFDAIARFVGKFIMRRGAA